MKKCQQATPTCSNGPDKICSDGKCYSQSGGCPANTTQVSSSTCTCSTSCSGSTSSLQVI